MYDEDSEGACTYQGNHCNALHNFWAWKFQALWTFKHSHSQLFQLNFVATDIASCLNLIDMEVKEDGETSRANHKIVGFTWIYLGKEPMN